MVLEHFPGWCRPGFHGYPTHFRKKRGNGWGTEVYSKCKNALEIELSGKLNCARGLRIAAGADRLIDRIDVAKKLAGAVAANWRAAVEVASWIGKVGVIEGVVGFQAHLNIARTLTSSNRNVFVDFKIGVVESCLLYTSRCV